MKEIKVLNFISDLPQKLDRYLQKKEIQINSVTEEQIQDWTHILTTQDHLDLIIETYSPIENNIQIIIFGEVEDHTKFIHANGKFVINENWLNHELATLFLDKMFYSQGGVSLEDNYPVFKLSGTFSIVDPYFSNNSIDKLIFDSLEKKAPAARVKSYLDHLLLHFSELKEKVNLVFPFDVNYGTYGDVFAVQVSFSSREIYIEDLTFSLENKEQNYFHFALKSSDFLDISYLSDVQKCTVTALWMNNSRRSSCFLINDVVQSNQNNIIEVIDDSEIELDIFSNVAISEDEKVSILKEVEQDNLNKVLASSEPDEEALKLINEVAQEVSKTHIHATNIEKDIIQIIKGKIDEEKKSIHVMGQKFDVDDFSFKVSSGVDKQSTGNDLVKIKALKTELPNAIRDRFVAFASSQGINLEEVEEYHIEAFKEKEIPELIRIKTKEIDDRFNGLNVKTVISASATHPDKSQIKENNFLKKKIQNLQDEIKELKEEKRLADKVQKESSKLSQTEDVHSNKEEELNSKSLEEMIVKMNHQKFLNESDTLKLTTLLEKEKKYIEEIKEADLTLKKQHIESRNKEAILNSEIRKLNQEAKAKDLISSKSKDSFNRLLAKRDSQIQSLNERLAQMTSSIVSNSEIDPAKISSLERQLQNTQKMLDIYKSKLAQAPQVKPQNDSSKEEVRKLTAVTNQLKNQLIRSDKESQKFEMKLREQLEISKKLNSEMNKLKEENLKLLSAPVAEASSEAATPNEDQTQQILELQNQLKEGFLRNKELEEKLIEALKGKKETGEDPTLKAKLLQQEASVKKLTADMVEARGAVQKMKQEIQKLRAEKTGLQNQLERAKKEQDRMKQMAQKNASPLKKSA